MGSVEMPSSLGRVIPEIGMSYSKNINIYYLITSKIV